MARLTAFLLRFRRQPLWRVVLVGEAVILLAASRIAIRVLPFRIMAWFLDKPFLCRSVPKSLPALTRRNVRRAIACGSAILPGKTVCFPRGVAAHVMCRIRGIETTLYYGAAILPNRGLNAHVWLQDGTIGITGKQEASEYCVLARFPVR
jgi:hypothetical protein